MGEEPTYSEIIAGTLGAALGSGTGLLFASLGEGYAERAGVVDVGIEGIMLLCAFVAFWVSLQMGLAAALVAALLIGAGMAAVHGFISVTLKGNQFISGFAIWIVGLGISSFLFETMVSSPQLSSHQIPFLNFPPLSNLPIIGDILFKQNLMVYAALALVPVFHFVLYHTKTGLNIRAVGDNPKAADAMGVHVSRTRMAAVILSGLMFGLGGYYYSVFLVGAFGINMLAGRGWISVVIAVFGKWDPKRILVGALLFGGADALALRLQASSQAPGALLAMLPYTLSIVAVVVISKRGGFPSALGTPYSRGE